MPRLSAMAGSRRSPSPAPRGKGRKIMPEEQAARAAMPLALAAGSSLVVLCALLGIYANLDLAFDPNWAMSRNIFSLKLLFAPAVLVDMSRIALPKNPQHRLYLPVFGAWVALFLALALFAASVVVDVLSNKNVVDKRSEQNFHELIEGGAILLVLFALAAAPGPARAPRLHDSAAQRLAELSHGELLLLALPTVALTAAAIAATCRGDGCVSSFSSQRWEAFSAPLSLLGPAAVAVAGARGFLRTRRQPLPLPFALLFGAVWAAAAALAAARILEALLPEGAPLDAQLRQLLLRAAAALQRSGLGYRTRGGLGVISDSAVPDDLRHLFDDSTFCDHIGAEDLQLLADGGMVVLQRASDPAARAAAIRRIREMREYFISLFPSDRDLSVMSDDQVEQVQGELEVMSRPGFVFRPLSSSLPLPPVQGAGAGLLDDDGDEDPAEFLFPDDDNDDGGGGGGGGGGGAGDRPRVSMLGKRMGQAPGSWKKAKRRSDRSDEGVEEEEEDRPNPDWVPSGPAAADAYAPARADEAEGAAAPRAPRGGRRRASRGKAAAAPRRRSTKGGGRRARRQAESSEEEKTETEEEETPAARQTKKRPRAAAAAAAATPGDSRRKLPGVPAEVARAAEFFHRVVISAARFIMARRSGTAPPGQLGITGDDTVPWCSEALTPEDAVELSELIDGGFDSLGVAIPAGLDDPDDPFGYEIVAFDGARHYQITRGNGASTNKTAVTMTFAVEHGGYVYRFTSTRKVALRFDRRTRSKKKK